MDDPKKYVTIKIKRRTSGDPGPPPSLAHGELAFNEVDNTLIIGTTQIESLSSDQ
jgi:hypothetical protein